MAYWVQAKASARYLVPRRTEEPQPVGEKSRRGAAYLGRSTEANAGSSARLETADRPARRFDQIESAEGPRAEMAPNPVTQT